jgi:glutathione peroxidase
MALQAQASEIYAQKVKTLEGKEVSLADYQGKTLLIVNTASKCGYTPQYEGLEALYKKYKDRGLVVMGFPSNDFGAQEPGTNQEIKKFCQTRFNVDFPMFEKGSVKGPQIQSFYKVLLKNAANQEEIKWNFEKFLVSPDGRVVARFGSKVTPEDGALISAIEKNLPKAGM